MINTDEYIKDWKTPCKSFFDRINRLQKKYTNGVKRNFNVKSNESSENPSPMSNATHETAMKTE